MLGLKVGEPETGRYIGQIPVAPPGGMVNGKRFPYRTWRRSAVLVRFLEVNRNRADVKQSEGRIADFNEKTLVFDGGVVKAAADPDAGLPRSTKDLPRQSVGGHGE